MISGASTRSVTRTSATLPRRFTVNHSSPGTRRCTPERTRSMFIFGQNVPTVTPQSSSARRIAAVETVSFPTTRISHTNSDDSHASSPAAASSSASSLQRLPFRTARPKRVI